MVLAELSMYPLDKGVSLSKYVARSLEIIDGCGLPYQFTPMSTIIEGEWDEVMDVVNRCFKAMEADCDRVSTFLRLDYRKDRKNAIKSKVESVEDKVGRKLKK